MGNLPQKKQLYSKTARLNSTPILDYPKLPRGSSGALGNKQSIRKSSIVGKDSSERLFITKTGSKITDKKDISFLTNAVSKHPLFYYIDETCKNNILKTSLKVPLAKSLLFYSKGNPAEYIFIVYKGCITLSGLIEENPSDFYTEEEKKKLKTQEVKEGGFLCDFEIVHNSAHVNIASTSPDEDTVVFAIPKETVKDVMKFTKRKNKDKLEKFFTKYLPLQKDIEPIKQSLINEHLVIWNYREQHIPLNFSNCFYLVSSGEVSTVYNNEIAKVLRTGDIIGHREFITSTSPNITLLTNSECEVFTLPFQAVHSLLGPDAVNKISYFFFVFCFSRSKTLSVIDTAVLTKVFPLFSLEQYSPNETIHEKGECLSDEVVVLLEGNICKRGENHYEGIRNDILYEQELVCSSGSVLLLEDLVAFPEALILKCDNEKIKATLNGQTLTDVYNQNNKKKTVREMTVELLKHCGCYNVPKNKLAELEKNVQIEKYDNNVKILQQGSKDLSKFYMIKSGLVNFYVNDKYSRTLGQYSIFGFKAYLTNLQARTATAIANGPCEIFAINAKTFATLVINTDVTISNYFKNKICLEDDTITLGELDNMRLLGKGSFGFVNLVKSRRNKMQYAIKAIPLKKVIIYDMYESTLNERNLLRTLDHNFIMKNVCSLKNDEFVFIVNEYIKGKTLQKVIKDIGMLTKSQCQFYSGSILKVIEYLHMNKIIHRDIKPENIMVNDNGFIKMIDFGTVKQTSSSEGMTHTIIGTPHYMAPEVINGDSYSSRVDYWSAAVCLYEFACGKVPFGSDTKDPTEIYKAVLNNNLTFPNNMKDKELINLLTGLLTKDIKKRKYGPDVINHPWFEGYDWKSLLDMTISVPVKPSSLDFEETGGKNGNYLNCLKVQLSKSKDNKDRELTKFDMEKGEKWLKGF